MENQVKLSIKCKCGREIKAYVMLQNERNLFDETELIKINRKKRGNCHKQPKSLRKNIMKCYKDGKWREICKYDECQHHIPSNQVRFI